MRGVRTILGALVLLATFGLTPAAPPGEVTGVTLDGASNLSWSVTGGADDYSVYRGELLHVAGVPGKCHGDEITANSFTTPADPAPGTGFFYLVTAESDLDGEGTPGNESSGSPRGLLGSCETVARNHVLSRVGFGWDEWSRDRLATLGIQGFIDEQLDPASINESANTTLQNRLFSIEPPEIINNLQAIQLVRAVYGWRQLEEQLALFWSNHFNTDYIEVYIFFSIYNPDTDRRRLETVTLQYEDIENFRDFAFNETFREMAEVGTLSPAMLIYLDNDNNIKGRPNENLGREVLELLTMGVDRYTQTDVEELSRVLTGWNVCKKQTGYVNDPLGPCIANSLIGGALEPPGEWVANFRFDQHDCDAKTLFAGTPQETLIPSTCDGNGQPTAAGVDDIDLALDAIVGHPATAEFISTKLLQYFVTEAPTQAMIDDVVATWNDGGNPLGVGDMREVVRAVLARPEFLDPDSAGQKFRDPFEQIVAAFRATRGLTDGNNSVRGYLTRMQQLYFQNPVPTGYSEIGSDWIGTNNVLERQNFAADFTGRTAFAYGCNVIPLLNDNGVSTAPGNAEAIVDFMIDALFGGALSPAERQQAIDFLNTDDNGAPATYNDARIRDTVGLMIGFAQFLEQ